MSQHDVIEDVSTEEEVPAEPEESVAPRQRSVRLSLPVTIALAVLLVAGIAAGIVFGLMVKGKNDVQAASDAALSTARSYAVTVTSYDYQNLDKNFADVLDGATGTFKDQYTGASGSLRQLIQEARATAKGDVVDAGVKSATTDRVDVVLFVDQSVTNAATAQPRVDRNRVLMTLEHHDTRWLVSNLQLL